MYESTPSISVSGELLRLPVEQGVVHPDEALS